MSTIQSIFGREILDSRGNPTVEVDVIVSSGAAGRAAVPSGASTGSREAVELRDGEVRYAGKGVQNALQNISQVIEPALCHQDWDQESLDQKLIELDGTEQKSNLGANAILGVSMAFAVASAREASRPLYLYLADIADTTPRMPMPILNVLNGGAHADWTTDIQEYMLFPIASSTYKERLRMAVEVFHHLAKILKSQQLSTNVGNEGGFAPALNSNEQPFELLLQAIEAAGYSSGRGKDFMLGIDAAASEFSADGQYQLKRDGKTLGSAEMTAWMRDLCDRYPIASLEDPLAEEDWRGWQALTAELGQKVDVVGDDLLVTNPKYIERAIEEKSCNTALIKLNQIGTVTETIRAMELARNAGWKNIVSHRSGETEDVFIAHLAVGLAADEIKAGAPSRSERTAKYNELLRIAEQIE